VLADEETNIFDGIVIDRSVLPGGHRFVDAPQVEEIYERGVVLSVEAANAEGLPEPSANPGVMEVTTEEYVEPNGTTSSSTSSSAPGTGSPAKRCEPSRPLGGRVGG